MFDAEYFGTIIALISRGLNITKESPPFVLRGPLLWRLNFQLHLWQPIKTIDSFKRRDTLV